MATLTRVIATLALSLAAWTAHAQSTTGSIVGRIIDAQGAAVPGVLVEARQADTGFIRTHLSDESGLYRLAALPVGAYEVTATLPGFQRFEAPVTVNLSREITLDVTLQVAGVAEALTVTAAPPLIATQSSSVGEVVDLDRLQGLPLNGRQFANLAATVPGVGLGFHSDVTKGAQYSPQISGGNGRNVNYVVDGGDNNDDTVGGLLQLFPLEAIEEFNVLTHRFDAEFGRSNGAVLNVVTRSGTNDVRASWFTLFRDDALNARTFSEELAGVEKQDYRRYQFGGSLGGPIARDRAHFFAAYERTQQDTRQVIDTLGLFPDQEGIFDVPLRQNLFTGKLTLAPAPAHYVTFRYGSDRNSQPSNVTPRTARSAWATSHNTFDSANVNHNWVIGGAQLNELVVQYSRFLNDVPANTSGASFIFPNGVFGGTNLGAPQKTEQTKWHVRDVYSWTWSGFGLHHQLRTGVNWVHEPRLYAFAGQGSQGIFTFGTLSPAGPIIDVLVIGGTPEGNLPMDLFGVFIQDDWRVTDRLTLNLGVRWDYVDGMPLDQSTSLNFRAMQAAGRAGRFTGTLLEEFGAEPRADRDNVQPRLGAAYDVRGDGRHVVRGGWGLYTDFGYTNSNALVAAFDVAQAGIVFSATSFSGLRKQDGTLFQAGDPLSAIAHLNVLPPGFVGAAGEVVSPRLEQPYSRQTNVGWASQLGDATTVSADYVRVDGRDLNLRVRPNVLVNGRRNLTGVGINPNSNSFRVALSQGESRYDGLILALRRRMRDGLDVTGSYTLADARSNVGTAYDELAQNLIQDISDPFGDVQMAPSTRTDSRHQVSISGIVEVPFGIRVAPVLFYRSALPVHTFEGLDLNADGNLNDRTAVAYRYTGIDEATGRATFEEDGTCATVNCSRRAGFSQLNLRVSRGFRLMGTARVEAIAEVFNLFNAKNPSLSFTQRRLLSNGAPNPGFMQPTAYAGDVQQPEQRVGQIGFRVTF